MELGFIVEVDGKNYGPFLKNQEKKFSHLRNRQGVVFKQVFLDEEQERKGKERKGLLSSSSRRTRLAAGIKTIVRYPWHQLHKQH